MSYQRKTRDLWGVFCRTVCGIEELYTATSAKEALQIKAQYTLEGYTGLFIRLYRERLPLQGKQ